MSDYTFLKPSELQPIYNEIVPAYQAAFAGEPWYEVSQCEDPLQRCDGGLSPVAIGSTCSTCGLCQTNPAYAPQEPPQRFEDWAASRATLWYVERSQSQLSLAAVAWLATPAVIAAE